MKGLCSTPVLLVLVSAAAFVPSAKLHAATSFSQTWSGVWNFARHQIIDEPTNPGNKVYQLPESTLSLELRPEFKLKSQTWFTAVLRPRAQLEQGSLGLSRREADPQATQSRAFINEAYGMLSLHDKVQLTLGLQNFQWGPTELTSPSNPLFRESGLDKTAIYETRGKALVRLNLSPWSALSVIALAEVLDNQELRPLPEAEFHAKGLLKLEYADSTQTNYIGLVLHRRQGDEPELGSYANFEVLPGLSAYYDANGRKGSTYLYPVFTLAGAELARTRSAATRTYLTGVFGLRYNAESGDDLRLEYFKDELAWTREERQAARAVLALTPTLPNFSAYLYPGSVLPGQRFLYASWRKPDLGPGKRFSLSTRLLHSLSDRSQRELLTLDSSWGDRLSLSTGLSHAGGAQGGELAQGLAWSAFVSGVFVFY